MSVAYKFIREAVVNRENKPVRENTTVENAQIVLKVKKFIMLINKY